MFYAFYPLKHSKIENPLKVKNKKQGKGEKNSLRKSVKPSLVLNSHMFERWTLPKKIRGKSYYMLWKHNRKCVREKMFDFLKNPLSTVFSLIVIVILLCCDKQIFSGKVLLWKLQCLMYIITIICFCCFTWIFPIRYGSRLDTQ